MNNFTHDELNLMSIYNSTGTREGLLRELAEMRGFLAEDETELLALTNLALDKLQAITDEEYVLLELFPDFE